MRKTSISWTDYTWNPVFGCSKVSPGCKRCYSERIALKFGHSKLPWTARNAALNVRLRPDLLLDPYDRKEPSQIFTCSMSDLFHQQVPDEYLRQVFAVMRDNPRHTFQILTKRPERAAEWPAAEWSPNIWMGTSVEDHRVLHRLDALRDCPAHVRFISAEPLIGPWPEYVDLSNFHWLIAGGESGKGFRPMPHEWARHLRDLCLDQGVAFFFKQSAAYRTESGAALRHADGSYWRWQQWPDQMNEPIRGNGHKYTYEEPTLELV